MEWERVGCEARIDNLLEAIADGTIAKELAKRNVAAEESKLQAVRARLAKLAPLPSPAPEDSQEAIQGALEATAALAAKKPEEARQLLGSIIQAVTVTPRGDQVVARIDLRNATATLGGGRVHASFGCGGAMMSFLSTEPGAMTVPIRGGVQRNAVFRGLRGALLSA
jgi:hypothetical protein